MSPEYRSFNSKDEIKEYLSGFDVITFIDPQFPGSMLIVDLRTSDESRPVVMNVEFETVLSEGDLAILPRSVAVENASQGQAIDKATKGAMDLLKEQRPELPLPDEKVLGVMIPLENVPYTDFWEPLEEIFVERADIGGLRDAVSSKLKKETRNAIVGGKNSRYRTIWERKES